jgi:PncC family amidohydrolase
MVFKQFIDLLIQRKLSLATAESASSGYLSYVITKTAGSSKVFKGGIIVYSLESKHKFFNIPLKQLDKTQGVSKNISLQLAKKTRLLFNADIGLALVGFAGPDKDRRRTGLFFIAVATPKISYAKMLLLKGNRDQTRKQACAALLNLLFKKVLCAHL